MGRVTWAAASIVALLASGGCTDAPYEPNWLFRGEWIDIDGRDRLAEETCGGTFAYLDAYAGALAVEFGVMEHLGSYRWYSREQYAADLPCGDDLGCFAPDDQCVHTVVLPHEHEMVHMVAFARGPCPIALSEGLAVFYSNDFGHDAKTSNFDLLVAQLETPSERLHSSAQYGMLGRFAAYLVERFGLEAVLAVCQATGRRTDGPALSAAMKSVLGMTTAELLADFEPELNPSCNAAEDYQSHVYACGAAQAAPDLGLVSVDGRYGIDVTFTLDCDHDTAVGPRADKIWITRRFDVDADEIYIASMSGAESGAEGGEIPEIELTLAKCEPCGNVVTIPGAFIGPEQLTAGRYSMELRAPADFRGSVNVTIRH